MLCGNRLEVMTIRMMVLRLLLLLAGMVLLIAHPQGVMVAITTAVTRAILTLLYAVACMVQLGQVLQGPVVVVQMGVLWGMVAEGIWVGIWAFGRKVGVEVARVVGELPGEIIVVGMTLGGIIVETMMGVVAKTMVEVRQQALSHVVVEKGLLEQAVVVAPRELQFGRLVVELLVAVRSTLSLGAVVGGLEQVLAGVGGSTHI